MDLSTSLALHFAKNIYLDCNRFINRMAVLLLNSSFLDNFNYT